MTRLVALLIVLHFFSSLASQMNALELKNYVLLLQNEYLSTKCAIFATNLCRKETQTPYKVAIAALH